MILEITEIMLHVDPSYILLRTHPSGRSAWKQTLQETNGCLLLSPFTDSHVWRRYFSAQLLERTAIAASYQ